MMKNRLKSIVLAIATVAIVIANNIGFGSFVGVASPLENRVDARPTFSRDGSVLDVQAAPVIRRNYSEEQIVSVSCTTKAGQVCPNSAVFNIRPSQTRNVIKLTTLSSCSALSYEVKTPDSFIGSTLVQPGKTAVVATHLMKRGSSYPFRITASGDKGACGTTGSWSAKVSLDMYQPPKDVPLGGPE